MTYEDLQDALKKCDATFVSPGPCLLPEYLAARREYHALLVAHGAMDPRKVEREPSAEIEEARIVARSMLETPAMHAPEALAVARAYLASGPRRGA